MNLIVTPVEMQSPEAFSIGQCMSKRAGTRGKKQKMTMDLENVNCKANLDGSRIVNLEKSGLKHESSF